MTQRPRNKQPRKKLKKPEPKIPQLFQVVVQCNSEADQRALYERLTAERRKCRLIIL